MALIRLAARWAVTAALVLNFLMSPGLTQARDTQKPSAGPLHYAPNGNFDDHGNYLPSKAGFNLADVSNVEQLTSLNADVKALVWVGQCNGADEAFRKAIQPYIGNPKVFGFFLMDDPDPRGMLEAGRLTPRCAPDNLKAESDWVHLHAPGAKTFIVLMNLASSKAPSFEQTYSPANSHIDLFGIDPYPCRTELQGCDYSMIDRFVAAATAWGIPNRQMVPVFQSFGGGDWIDDYEGKYLLPTVEQTQGMLARWRRHIVAPAFDFAYSWGSQRSDSALASERDLQDVFLAHNRSSGPLNSLIPRKPAAPTHTDAPGSH